MISEEYMLQLRDLHKRKHRFGANGQAWARYVAAIAAIYDCHTLVDYGCGKGTLKGSLDLTVHEYDPAIPQKSELPPAADMVVTTDVLEHIEPDMLWRVLEHLRTLTWRIGFHVICCRPASKDLPDGRNAHLIVEPPEWWHARLAEHFNEIIITPWGDGKIIALTR